MDRLRLRATALFVSAFLGTIACGGSERRSPTGPSSTGSDNPASPPSTVGATISGKVVTGIGGLQILDAGLSGVKISVSGTPLMAVTSSSGAFQLKGVPPGLVRLLIEAGGASTTLELDDVSQTEEISLTVLVDGSTIELAESERVTGSQAQLEGKVASANYPARSLVIGTTTVSVPDGIPITKGSRALELEDVIVGARIHVKGAKSGDAITATSIIVQQTDGGGGPDKTVEISGTISGLTGKCPARKFQVAGHSVKTNGATTFRTPCAGLSDGQNVHVKGKDTGDGTVNASDVQ